MHTTVSSDHRETDVAASAAGDNYRDTPADTKPHRVAANENAGATHPHLVVHAGVVPLTRHTPPANDYQPYSYSRLNVAIALNGPRSMLWLAIASGSPCT